jgi:hypothetical protein
MEKFEVWQTAHTPYFSIDYDKGYILYKGRFLPSIDPFDFMTPVTEAIETYINQANETTVLEIFYEYVNTGNLLTFLNFFKLFKKIEDKNKELICIWHYDSEADEDSIDMCEHVAGFTGLYFEMVNDSETEL